MSAEEYMHVILGVLSLKYISDRYKIGMAAAIAEGFTEEDLDFDDLYYTYHAFKVTEKAS